jgi:urease accessory protein
MTASLLLLADSRLPAGGHAHSGGLEPAVHAGLVRDLNSLESWLRGRLATSGRVAAAFGAAAARLAAGDGAVVMTSAASQATLPASGSAESASGPGPAESASASASDWAELSAELDARTPSGAARAASRAQGRSLLRIVAAVHGPDRLAVLRDGCGPAPHHPLVFGAACAAADITASDAALALALASVTAPASAAVRLLGLDPVGVHALLATLAVDVDAVAATAAHPVAAHELPAAASPLLDILTELHTSQNGRLFAS